MEDRIIQVLLVEDNPGDARLIRELLAELPHARLRVTHCDRLAAAQKRLATQSYQVALLDLNLPDSQGLETLAALQACAPQMPVVVLSGLADIALSVEAVRSGAQDYLFKSEVTPALLERIIGYAIERKHVERELVAALEAARRRSEEVEALLQASRTALISRDFEHTARAIYETCKRVIGASVGYVLLIDEDGEPLFVDLGAELCTEISAGASRLCGLKEKVYRSHEAIYVNDFGHSEWQQYLPQYHIALENVLFAPLMIEERVVGLLGLGNKRGGFDENDARLATAFGEQLSAVWHRHKLLQELEQKIAELESTREQFLQAQKMEALGRLAGGVAHDFNNLLTVINGYSQILLSDLDPADTRYELLQEILRAGRRAADVTQQLLAFSRRQPREAQVLDLNELLTDMRRLVRSIIGEDVELLMELREALGAVRTDRNQLEQVVMNLVVNARDAMPGGGTLTLRTANAHLDAARARAIGVLSGEYVLLSVSDNGHGIPPEVMAHIFEPFFTTKGVGKGTGLGLSTVYGIVTQSGGGIQVQSEVGRGTTFYIYLPRVFESAEERREVSAGEPPRGDETILVVEDELLVRQLVRQALGRLGYTILEASNGREALELCRRQDGHIDLVLTDVVMPEMSGRELGRALREYHPDLRILYMSGYTNDVVDADEFTAAGERLLHKPLDPTALPHQIRQLLDGR